MVWGKPKLAKICIPHSMPSKDIIEECAMHFKHQGTIYLLD